MATLQGLKAKWFWYSVLCVLCWGAWVLCSKLGTNQIPASTMQFIFAFGFIPVAILVLVVKPVKFEKSVKGISYSLGNGILAGIGGLTLFAAYRSGGNTSVITAATALYPLITVVLAVLVLRERLNWLQVVGLGFAVAAIIIFSL
jgi:bacterial/archaeal transporter family protein